MGTRVLVPSADIGEGHVTAARSLTESLREHAGIDAVELRTDLSVMTARPAIEFDAPPGAADLIVEVVAR
jgi:hypothetical protein